MTSVVLWAGEPLHAAGAHKFPVLPGFDYGSSCCVTLLCASDPCCFDCRLRTALTLSQVSVEQRLGGCPTVDGHGNISGWLTATTAKTLMTTLQGDVRLAGPGPRPRCSLLFLPERRGGTEVLFGVRVVGRHQPMPMPTNFGQSVWYASHSNPQCSDGS